MKQQAGAWNIAPGTCLLLLIMKRTLLCKWHTIFFLRRGRSCEYAPKWGIKIGKSVKNAEKQQK